MTNFTQMSTKKLNTLLEAETITPEEKEQINKVIELRNAAKQTPTTAKTAAEEAAGKPAEIAATASKPDKMTDQEREDLAVKLRETALNHKCEVVPFNCLEWVHGVISGIIEDKKHNKVMFAVKTEDGKRIIKAHDSKLIKVLDEVVEKPARIHKSKVTLDENGNPVEVSASAKEPWTEEDIEQAVQKAIGNVGKKISFPQAGRYGIVEEGAPVVTGRIVSLVPVARTQSVLYRILLDKDKDDENEKDIYAHKTSSHTYDMDAELDEVGLEINKKFCARRYKENVTVAKTPEEAFKLAEARYNKAQESLKKAQDWAAKCEEKYNAAKAAYEASLTEGNGSATNTEEPTNEELM